MIQAITALVVLVGLIIAIFVTTRGEDAPPKTDPYPRRKRRR